MILEGEAFAPKMTVLEAVDHALVAPVPGVPISGAPVP